MSQHTGYATILDGETTYGITFTDVEEYTQNGKYTALVLAGTYKDHVSYDGQPTNPSPSYPVRINLYYDADKGVENGIIDGACAITTPDGVKEHDLHDTCAKYLEVFGTCTMHAAIYDMAAFFHNSLHSCGALFYQKSAN